jgi:hypothetical protein
VDLDLIRRWTYAWNRVDIDVIEGSFAADAEVIPDPATRVYPSRATALRASMWSKYGPSPNSLNTHAKQDPNVPGGDARL